MATKVKKVVLLDRLLSEGFFTSKEEAVPYLMGGQVYVGSQQQTSAAAKVDPLLPLTVRGLDMPYISKGGLKLEGAIRDLRSGGESELHLRLESGHVRSAL